MAFTSLTTGQTDADSPVNETLMDLIRTNLDDLDTRVTSLGVEGVNAWASVTWSGGTPTLDDSFNVSDISDDGIGLITFTWDTVFDTANYALAGGLQKDSTGALLLWQVLGNASDQRNVGSVQIEIESQAALPDDPFSFMLMAIGDQ